jgi:hypothetical protein
VGTPILPERWAWKWQSVASGEVSVEPPGRYHRQRAADGLDRELFQRIPEILRQRRAGIEREFDFAEKTAAQLVIAAQGCDQHVKTARHIEVHRRYHAAQIGQ